MRSAEAGAVEVLHLTTVHTRGDTRIYVKEVRTLSRELGEAVGLAVADGEGTVTEESTPPVFDLGRAPGGRAGRWLKGSLAAYRLVRRIRPGVIHFHDPELIPLALVLRARGHRVVYDAHEDTRRQISGKPWIRPALRRPLAALVGALEWMAARRFDAVVAATPSIAERFPRGKVVLVQNFPIRSELIPPRSVPYRTRPPAFAYVGGISRIRGAVEMVGAMGHLADVEGVALEMAGSMESDELARELRALPGWTSVRYHGYVDRLRIAELLGGVRAGIVTLHPLPNYVESQPIKMFEYMAAGLPVVASDFPHWRRIIDGAGCGLLVDPEDPRGIADALRWILDNPAEAERMGRRGREAVDEGYNWEAEAESLMALYRRLVAP